MMKLKYLIPILTIIILSILFYSPSGKFPHNSQQSGLPTVYAQVQSADPCQSPAIAKASAVINIASATTVSLVAPGVSASSVIYVCGFSLTISGTTTPTFQLEYGTGATCGTGTTVMTGAYVGGATSAPTFILAGTPATIAPTAAANRLCAVAGGTAPNDQGVIWYVQQPQ